ncbi:hypothetical protein [Vulcanisaeta sp. JCM 16159]|uniref:hypothetical protein n=1 Tax=Vulcanisaeta sp. JCM 16159 TaxID=1295371 RepID=UPI0006D1A191|nr:hypothetical protein [Vulcanisaeta sp. JCM 16159]
MALADSLVFPDLLISIMLIVAIFILTIYLTNQLLRLSIIDYRATMGTYLFTECQLGNFTGNMYLDHVIITNKVTMDNYLVMCPRILSNGSQLEVNVYVAYVR